MLINYFLHSKALKLNKDVPEISPEVYRFLLSYSWPGNVRELRNLVERSLILGWFDIGPEPEGRPVQAPAGLDETLEAVEKRHILAVLAAADGNKSEASRRLGISRKTMDRKCQAWGL